jgi:hypothetical protein
MRPKTPHDKGWFWAVRENPPGELTHCGTGVDIDRSYINSWDAPQNNRTLDESSAYSQTVISLFPLIPLQGSKLKRILSLWQPRFNTSLVIAGSFESKDGRVRRGSRSLNTQL